MLTTLLAALNDCVWTLDVNAQKYLFISPRIYVITDFSVKEFQENLALWGDIIDERDREAVSASSVNIMVGEWTELTYRIVCKSGKIKWILHKKTCYLDEETGHQVLLNVITDVSSQKETDFRMQESLGNFSILFNDNPTPMWIYELPSLRILKANTAALKHYGYSEEDFLSMTIRDLRPKFDLAKFNDYLYRKTVSEDSLHGFNRGGVWRHQNKKGEIIYAEITGHEIKFDGRSCRVVIATDITEKVLNQEALKQREQFLTSLIDSQTNFLVRIDIHYNFIFVNKWFNKIFGYKKNEIIGKPFSNVALPEEKDLCEQIFKNCVKNCGKVISLKHRSINPDTTTSYIKWEFIALTDQEGQVTELQGIGQDITKSVEIEKEIKKAAENLNNFIESITDSFFIIDREWKFVKMNGAFEKVTGRSRDAVLGSVIWDVFPGIVGTEFEESYRKAMTEQVSVQFSNFFKPLNKWFSVTIYPATEGLTVFVKDITYEKTAQEEMVWTKNNLEALINNTEDLTWSINSEGQYVYMNSAYRERVAKDIGVYPKEGDSVYQSSGDVEQLNKEWRSYYQRAFSGERYVTRYESNDPITKEPTYHEVSFNPIYKASKDEIIGVGCFARDITDRLKTEGALIEQNERLKNIASLSSHELRRPVASLMGLLNIIDREDFSNPENEQIIDHLFTVTHEIDEVIRLIVNKTFIDTRFPL